MPVAVCVVDLGLSRASRRSDSVRVNHASAVASNCAICGRARICTSIGSTAGRNPTSEAFSTSLRFTS